MKSDVHSSVYSTILFTALSCLQHYPSQTPVTPVTRRTAAEGRNQIARELGLPQSNDRARYIVRIAFS